MRYITHIPDLVLYQNNGVAAYTFGLQGILDLGSRVAIDADPGASSATDLMLIYPTDLLGFNTPGAYLELAGQGSLTSEAVGGSLTTLSAGFRGLFFEAPAKAGTDAVPAVAGIRYIVLSGTVTYKAVDYVAGEEFVTAGGTTTTTGSGAFALSIPSALSQPNVDFSTEAFRLNQLLHGDEALNAYKRNLYGYDPRTGLDSTAADYYGWTRS